MTKKETLFESFRAAISGGHGDQNELNHKLTSLVRLLSDFVYENCFRTGGTKNASVLDPDTDPDELTLYVIGTGGAVGDLTTVTGDVVYYLDGAWHLFSSGAGITWGGTQTSVNLEAQESPTKNKMYQVSSIATSATIGTLTAKVGDLVLHNGTAWVKVYEVPA